MNPLDYFPADYFDARERFRSAATAVGAQLLEYPLESEPGLTIDVAILGGESARDAIVVSSGLHGVEGYFGTAAQLAWLDSMESSVLARQRIVLVHAMNPFGYAHQRRWDEQNVDLNRNFLEDRAEYSGAPDHYAELDSLLNPTSPPSRLEPFRAKAMWAISRMGLQAVKNAVAGGQYTHPNGLFFGGHDSRPSTRVVQRNLRLWIGDATNVVHVDLHTGLGKSAEYKLLLSETTIDEWYLETFGTASVESMRKEDGTAYHSRGTFGGWASIAFPDLNYKFVLAEFGTYGVIRVLAALRSENRAHFYCQADDVRLRRAKSELVECFCPADPSWRAQVISTAMDVFQQATDATWNETA